MENKSRTHNLNETQRRSSNVDTSEFDQAYLEIGEQDNNACQTFPDNLSKSEQHDPTQSKLQFIFGDFMEMMKLLNADLKHVFILNIRGLNIQLKRMRLFVSVVASGREEGLHFVFCLKKIQKLSTKQPSNGPRKTVFFLLW